MTWSAWIRQLHRWLSILFTLTVIANFVQLGMGKGNPPNAVTYSPLFPLALMTVSGLYMFALPYVARWRNRHRDHERMRAQHEGSVEMTAP